VLKKRKDAEKYRFSGDFNESYPCKLRLMWSVCRVEWWYDMILNFRDMKNGGGVGVMFESIDRRWMNLRAENL